MKKNQKDTIHKGISSFVKLPDYFSLASLSLSLLSMALAYNLKFDLAAILIVISALLDGMDGIAARLIHRRGRFGAELDSIADVIAFGVAPAVFAYCLGLKGLPELFLLIAFVLASALRLARFNIMKVRGHYFIGLPTTSNGVIIPAIYFILELTKASWPVTQIVMLCWFAFSTVLMISTLRVPKPQIG
jgi:CDP-diacylglycerol--serine O-phosphatidyltransferase